MNNFIEDINMLQTIERFLEGNMLPDEFAYFEQIRKNTPEIDQMVVEHNMFLHQMNRYATQKNVKHSLHEVHAKLLERGDINEGVEQGIKGRVVQLYQRYRRVTAIAAMAGGAIALVISGLVSFLAPTNNSKLQQLSQDIAILKQNQQYQSAKLREVDSKIPKNAIVTGGGSGFLVDAKGYLITNAHVLHGSNYANVISANHDEFKAAILYRDELRDLALLKIDDEDFKPLKSLPYSIRKMETEIGQEVFTLGYPRNDITYNKGDMSAKTGFNGDTSSFQIQMSANPGNSGGPVLNTQGEVIGVLSTREKQADGVTFAIKSKNIYQFISELKLSDTSFQKLKLPVNTSVTSKNLDRIAQVKQMQNCVYMVQAFNKKSN